MQLTKYTEVSTKDGPRMAFNLVNMSNISICIPSRYSDSGAYVSYDFGLDAPDISIPIGIGYASIVKTSELVNQDNSIIKISLGDGIDISLGYDTEILVNDIFGPTYKKVRDITNSDEVCCISKRRDKGYPLELIKVKYTSVISIKSGGDDRYGLVYSFNNYNGPVIISKGIIVR